jgi:hypothetical protein
MKFKNFFDVGKFNVFSDIGISNIEEGAMVHLTPKEILGRAKEFL